MCSSEWQQHLSWIGESGGRLEVAERLGSSISYSSGDEYGPHFIGNREGLFSAAKMLHNDLWIGTED